MHLLSQPPPLEACSWEAVDPGSCQTVEPWSSRLRIDHFFWREGKFEEKIRFPRGPWVGSCGPLDLPR